MVWGYINIEGSGGLGVKSYLLPANSLVFSTARVMVDFHGLKLDRFKGGRSGGRGAGQKESAVNTISTLFSLYNPLELLKPCSSVSIIG